MKALSILQPYAWLIVNGHKDIENRGWHSRYRGAFVVHAGKAYSRRTHDEYAEDMAEDFGIRLPAYEDMARGAVVGSARMVDCVREHPSRWKILGSWGFVLTEPKAIEPVSWRGQLGFFDIPREPFCVARSGAPNRSEPSDKETTAGQQP